MGEEKLALLYESAMQHAKRLYLQSHPLHDEELLGQYAYLLHKNIPTPACCLYYLDRKSRLLDTQVLYSGVTLSVEDCCARLSARVKALGAARAAVSMARTAVGMDGDDLDRASRIALFCEAEHLPLWEILWVDEDSYLPLCRYFGRRNHNE